MNVSACMDTCITVYEDVCFTCVISPSCVIYVYAARCLLGGQTAGTASAWMCVMLLGSICKLIYSCIAIHVAVMCGMI